MKNANHLNPGGFTRRSFLQCSLLASVGAMVGRGSAFAGGAQNAPMIVPAGPAKAVIQIWLWGGACHIDTFDPKPAAGYDYCGALAKALPTNVDGIQIGELLPGLAQQADKYSLIRSMTHGNNSHETAAYLVQTGHTEGGPLVYPSAGAVVSLMLGIDAGYEGLLPPYVVLTETQGRFSECGFLGPRYKPFATGGDPSKSVFAVEGIVAEGLSEDRQRARRKLLAGLDTLGAAFPKSPIMAEFKTSEEGAYDMILGDGKKVFDLAGEEAGVRDRYGRNSFGQSCLVARRLVESGVKFVTINSKGWDTHKQHFPAMRRKLPELDKGLSTLLDDLADRGLLDSTIVWCGGEFGRTPKVQWEAPWNGGRSHHGKVFSTLVAGGGFRGGHVVGASDAYGMEVAERPVYPWDLVGSIYELLGINPDAPYPNKGDDAIRLVQQVEGEIRSGGRLHEIMKL